MINSFKKYQIDMMTKVVFILFFRVDM